MDFAIVGFLAAAFVMTAMMSQLFPDGRFPLSTILLVMVASASGAWVGNELLGRGILTGALVGAGVVSGLLLFLLHRIGLLVNPLPPDKDNPGSR